MGLKKKTFLYSTALAAIMLSFVLGYFVLMLPSLYVDYVMDSNLRSVAQIQQGYMSDKTYDDLSVKNPSATFTLEVPNEGRKIYIAGKYYKAAVTIRDDEVLALLNQIRSWMDDSWNGNAADGSQEIPADFELQHGEDFSKFAALWEEELKEKFTGQNLIAESYPIEIAVESRGNQEAYHGEYEKLHSLPDGIIVYETGVSDGSYSYTTYIALGRASDCFVITVLPTMTPRMEEITPIVMNSLPMISAVIFLVVLISSNFFSGRIVNPIIRLAGHAESARLTDHFEADTFDSDRADEIGVLGRNLHELYGKLRDNYEELACKNRILEEENERQEVFLRASSHQLKTPIAAALLLVEGIINEVGKYKDSKKYLPEVKRQLLSMRKIVEDILYLNYHTENMHREDVAVKSLIQDLVSSYAVQIENKGLQVTVTGRGSVSTDREMLRKIVDNLLSNAVQYTPKQQAVVIEISDRGLCITNCGVTIATDLLPNIFEPFVSSGEQQQGTGLGLYVAAYYSRFMGYQLNIENHENSVRAKLSFEEK